MVSLKRALIPFILVLILTLQTLNMQRYAGIENTSFVAIDPSDNVRKGEINHNKSGEIYRDGIIDNFDNYTNPGFPTEHNKFYLCSGS
jgi:hypothetical protein